jgi:hypothetical protein
MSCWQIGLLLFFVGQPVALFFGYAVGIQYQRESLPQWVRNICEVVALLATIVDVLANFTVLLIYLLDLPRWGEWTFSTRLERLVLQPGLQGRVAIAIARVLNRIAPPGHPHIKAAVGK